MTCHITFQTYGDPLRQQRVALMNHHHRLVYDLAWILYRSNLSRTSLHVYVCCTKGREIKFGRMPVVTYATAKLRRE